MLFGIALIFLIQWVFLGNLRCALIVAATIPVALFLAVIITVLRGRIRQPALGRRHRSRHHRRCHRHHGGEHLPPSGASPRGVSRSDRTPGSATSCTACSPRAVEVDKPIFFSVIITIAAFLPLFTMQGVEGQIFGPMSRTYAYALLGAVIATFTVTPVLSSVLLPERVNEVETFLVRISASGLSERSCRSRCATIGWRRRRASSSSRCAALLGLAARHRVPAQARRGQPVDSRAAAADDHARGRHG